MNKNVKRYLSIDPKENDFAPWITLGIQEMQKRNDIELHIIAPFYRIRLNRSFIDQGIHYHCIKAGIPLFKTAWPHFFKFDRWSNFLAFKLQVKRLINKINPDIVDIHGAENPHYSSSALVITNCPVIVTIQGFFSLYPDLDEKNPEVRKTLKIERRILKTIRFFGLEGNFAETYIKSLNPDARIFRYHCPYAKTELIKSKSKEYDLVYFTKISRMKGIEDLIKALSLVKKDISDIRLLVIGRGPEKYLKYLNNLIADLGLKENVIYKGHMNDQKKMHEEVVKAKLSVLPTYNDRMSGTIVESMLLGIPVVSYDVGGNPDLNSNDENIILVKAGDIKNLAIEIVHLLKSEEKRQTLAEKALHYSTQVFDNKASISNQIRAYKEVIKEYNRID
jgi:glycosyltransferase involved in cell wall biosynthesis